MTEVSHLFITRYQNNGAGPYLASIIILPTLISKGQNRWLHTGQDSPPIKAFIAFVKLMQPMSTHRRRGRTKRLQLGQAIALDGRSLSPEGQRQLACSVIQLL
jgi:hypothetical protein